jgi:hypothetical protein
MRSDPLQFGAGPRSWMISGILVCLAGLVPLFLGMGFLWTLAEHGSLQSHGGTILGVGCVLFGMLFVVDGLLIVVQRKRLKIALSGQAVHVGRLCRSDDVIAFTDIRRVRRGLDGVLLEVVNRRLPYPIDSFKSLEEQASFIEELSRRISSAKNTPHASAGTFTALSPAEAHPPAWPGQPPLR